MSQPLLTADQPVALLPAPREHSDDHGEAAADKTRGKPAPDKSDHREGKDEQPPRMPKFVFAIVFIAVVGLIGYGVYRHWQLNGQAEQTQQENSNPMPTVRVGDVKHEIEPIKTVLPAQTEAFQTATIYARATGYISERLVDIGSRVKKGDLLVKISAPDLDQQLAQAEAQVEQTKAALDQAQAQVTQAKATLALQTTNLQRADTLTRQGYETVQNQQTQQTTVQTQQAALTTAQAGVKVSEANLKAQQATVDRLKALTAFERVVAPFDGVVTQRNTEVGDLVNADQGTGTPLFRVDEYDVLRVAILVPQYASDGVRDGLDAKVTAPELPGRVFTGKVSRTSVSLLYSSRTLTTEVDVANPDGSLRPGQFVNVEIDIPRTTPTFSVPSDALIFNQNGTMVATVEEGDSVKFHKVEIVRDLGTSLELKDGLKGGEKAVLDAPVDLADGEKVKIAPPPKQDKSGGDQKGDKSQQAQDNKGADKSQDASKSQNKTAETQKSD